MSEKERISGGTALRGASVVVLALAVLALAWAVIGGGDDAGERLVVYCAHDSVYAESVFNTFQERTGIAVDVVYDTEATKSVGLVERLLAEKNAPRCDVFWNNELLGTMDLKEAGVLESYKGPGYERIPVRFRDPDGCWTGFGSRLRVYIVNTENMQATPAAVDAALAAEDISNVCIAKPNAGTTVTHFAVLWKDMGAKAVKAWHAERLERGLRVVDGNGQTKRFVAEGVCDLGYTDTDDYFMAREQGSPVEALPVRLADGATICIPNTVGIIKGSRNLEAARELVDYLLSAECELNLANSLARQIPLGDVDEGKLPDEVRTFRAWAADAAPLEDLLPARGEVLEWMKEGETD